MLLSIVVPVFNEEANINKFYQSVTEVLKPLGYDYEIIFVDDGSRDKTSLLLEQLSKKDAHVKALLLARNFGHQIALTCGMDAAKGDAVITMDGDMQHPPALIPKLVHLWEEGNDVVRTVRDSTEDAGLLKSLTSKYYYKFMNLMSDVPILEGGSDFRLVDRKALDTLLRFREHGRFLRGIVGDLGYKQVDVHFVAPPRYAGHSKFSIKKMVHLALDGIAAFSTVPLRAAFYVGLLCGLLSIFMIFHILYVHFVSETTVSGWATLGVAIFFVGGVQLICIGVIGEYVGRIFEEVKHRPLYWTRGSYNCKENDNTHTK